MEQDPLGTNEKIIKILLKRRQEAKLRKKVKKCQYSKENLRLAVEEALRGESISKVSKKYQVPESTIRDRRSSKNPERRPGPLTVLSAEEENEIIKWIIEYTQKGFLIVKNHLFDSVQLMCNQNNRSTPFKNNRPGRSWYERICVRQPDLSKIISENTVAYLATISESKIRIWFAEMTSYLSDQNLLSIHPSRIFNANTTRLHMNPKNHLKKSKNNNDTENITVLFAANAEGTLAPSLILFTGSDIPEDVKQFTPSNMALDSSELGLMTPKNYYNYIVNVFYPWLRESNIEFPVILFIDRCNRYITFTLTKFCEEHQIILIALPSNASYIIQPLDFTFFESFKIIWETAHKSFCQNFGINIVEKHQFSLVARQACDILNNEDLLKNRFKISGLCPFNVNAIDFNQVFKRNDSVDENTLLHNNFQLKYAIEQHLDEFTLQSFRSNEDPIWSGRIEDKSLFELWFKLSHPVKNDRTDFVNVKTESEDVS